jgi:copper chaperone NosL
MSAARWIATSCLFVSIAFAGCGEDSTDGPPSIRYGDSICEECGMIISDDRFATSSVYLGDRGNEHVIFDDFNCQINYEKEHTQLSAVDRWSHDYATRQWLHMADAWYVQSPDLHTPMASHIASFSTRDDADAFAATLNTKPVDFSAIWTSD